MRKSAVLAVAVVLTLTLEVFAQGPPKPGPEHKAMKKREGIWTTLMKADGKDHKGTVTFKMELGGLWLVGSMESDLGDMKFYGKGLDTYDAKTKKYRSVWFDSMGVSPLIMEGNYSKDGKTLTMTGKGEGMDGKITDWKSVSTMPDDDTIHVKFWVGDGKEPMFTVTYKRKK